jgi:hypothetical protein
MRPLLVFVIACGGAPAPSPSNAQPTTASPEVTPSPREVADQPQPQKRALPGTLEMRKLETAIKMFYNERADLPPTAAAMPGELAALCGKHAGEFSARPATEWFHDPGWKAIGFAVEGPSKVVYTWTRSSATAGFAIATTDLDCDGIAITYRIDLSVIDGGAVRATHTPYDVAAD